MPGIQKSKFIDQNPDMKWHFGHLFLAIVVAGHYSSAEKTSTRPSLPVGTRELDGLHRVLGVMIEESCFPDWFRDRIFIQKCWDGPLCEDLYQSLAHTALYTHWGKFHDNYWEAGSFELTMDFVEARAILEQYEVNLDTAEEWGKKFFMYWDEVKLEMQEFRALRSSSRISLI